MTLRDDLLPTVDALRALPEAFGLRRYSVAIRRRAWSGGEPGEGTATTTDTVITPRPKVRQMSAELIAASGGTFEAGDYVIERITPSYTGGGYSPTALQLVPAAGEDVAIVLTGDDGVAVECALVKSTFDRALRYGLVVRRIKGPSRG